VRAHLKPLDADVRRPSRGAWGQRSAVVAIVVALYVAACALPAVQTYHCDFAFKGSSSHLDEIGLVALLLGWLEGSSVLFWMANPLLFLSLALLLAEAYRSAAVSAAAGTAFAASLLAAMTTGEVARMAGPLGNQCHVTKVYSGYFFWLSSHLALMLGSLALLIWGRSARPAPPRLGPDAAAAADAPRTAPDNQDAIRPPDRDISPRLP
jgi:hypothetical protein